jgi:hypothetical protein
MSDYFEVHITGYFWVFRLLMVLSGGSFPLVGFYDVERDEQENQSTKCLT